MLHVENSSTHGFAHCKNLDAASAHWKVAREGSRGMEWKIEAWLTMEQE